MTIHPEVLVPGQGDLLAASGPISEKWGAYLAGGAAVALQVGHRRSKDFDWFTRQTLNPADLLKDLKSLGLPVTVRQNDVGTFHGTVGDLDYSVFRYPYETIERTIPFKGCKLASLVDVAAMKMAAIVQRRAKRDYVDLHVLYGLAGLKLAAVVSTMKTKFPGVNPSVALYNLTYFKDIEKEAMPEMLMKISWQDVQRGLIRVRDRGLGPDPGLSR